MAPHRSYQWSKETLTKKPCKHCRNLYLPQGIKQHEKRCVEELSNWQEQEKHNKAYIRNVHQTKVAVAKEAAAAMSLLLGHSDAAPLGSAVAVIPVPPDIHAQFLVLTHCGTASPTDTFTFNEDDISMGMISPHISNMLDPAPAASHSTNHPPDFKTEFHPCSKCPTLYQSFEDFGQQIPKDMALVSELWHPFASEGDYIFATITVEAGLTSTQVDSLLTLFHCIKQGMTSVTLINDAGLCTALDRVALQLMPFLKFEITAPYKGEDVMFQVHACPLWDWALDLLQNPSLTPHFVWDAQWLFKHDGEKYKCFYTEPWTGWLPIVPELTQEERKTSYANFKCAVWHEAFFKLLEKVAKLSKVGYLYKCYDKVLLWLFPIILILSADYEELEQHKEALAVYMDKKLVEHSEPEQAASFEPLHSLHGGMGGKHMHKELKIAVSELGHNFETKLEEQVSAFPHWWGLAHFDTVIHITFSDGNKIQDITRQCFYAALNILMTESSPAGYQLLCMMCSYLQLDSLIGLDVQTEKTIAMIENELIVFRDELKENWNFPKAHLWKHITHDIQSKGAIHNYSAQPNEKMHGPLKDAYQDCSNVCIDAENKHTNLATGNDAGNNKDNSGKFEENTKLSAPQQPTSLSEIETAHEDDRAFDRFHQKLETFLNTCLPTYRSLSETKITFVQLIFFFTYPNHDGEFLVVEHIDGDMFLHMKEWTRTHHQAVATAKHIPSSESDQMPTKTQSDGLGQGSDHSDLDDNTPDLEELQELRRVMHEAPPDTSAPQLCVALGTAQLAYSKLHTEMKKLQTNYDSLLSTLPQNHKRAVENNLNTALENNIAA
ncbi:hypothetical protein EDC04DRAFT_2611551 [Pisolithus marmoratus]|nr:hypothetical protein EDC04DRAFT_2611551 [Pisolithus marmoratus]